jgi:hypothetical protein
LKSAAKNTFHTAISEGQEKCRASGAYIDGFINLGDEVYSYKAEIPKFSPQNNHKTVQSVDKTRIENLNCREKVKKYIFLVLHPGIIQISPH